LVLQLISSPKLLQKARVVVFARKPEARHLATICEIADRVQTFLLSDLAISFFQPYSGASERAWCNETARFTAQTYGIITSHRLMTDRGLELLEHHPEGVYPTLRQLVEYLEQYKPRDYFRDAQYKTSIVSCLKDLLNCTGRIFDYSMSNFLEILFSTPGLAIIEVPVLPQQHLTFLATYMIRWLYFGRVQHE
jgi:hypothetical protein